MVKQKALNDFNSGLHILVMDNLKIRFRIRTCT